MRPRFRREVVAGRGGERRSVEESLKRVAERRRGKKGRGTGAAHEPGAGTRAAHPSRPGAMSDAHAGPAAFSAPGESKQIEREGPRGRGDPAQIGVKDGDSGRASTRPTRPIAEALLVGVHSS